MWSVGRGQVGAGCVEIVERGGSMGLAGKTSPSALPPRIGVVGEVTTRLKCRILAQLADCECELVWGAEDAVDAMVVVGGKTAKGVVPGEWLMKELAGYFIQLAGGMWVLVLPLNPDDEILERVRWLT